MGVKSYLNSDGLKVLVDNTKSYVDSKIASIVDSAPETLDTLNELAQALGNDENFATTVVTEIGTKAEQKDLDNLTDTVNQILNMIYPVGSIYLSVVNTSPSIIFGGTWEQIEDTFLLAAGSTYSAGTTGGEASHTLSLTEMPSHIHEVRNQYIQNSLGEITKDKTGFLLKESSISYTTEGTTYHGAASAAYFGKTGYTGGVGSNHIEAGEIQPHNNMPPYLTVYMWKRVS